MAQNFYSEVVLTSPLVVKTPTLEWTAMGTEQKTPSLEWVATKMSQLAPTLEWVAKDEVNFCPNLINFTYDWLEPKIISKEFTASVYGCLYGYSINFDNSGTSGSTEIQIYINTTLKKTVTISATNAKYTEVYHFGLTDEIESTDSVVVKVNSLALNTEGLKVNVYQMSFPFIMEKIVIGNRDSDALILGQVENSLFNSADYWAIEMNQPINSIVGITGLVKDGTTEDLTATIEDGLFKDSRIQITPFTTKEFISISVTLKDKNNKLYSFNFDVTHFPTYGNLFDYNFADSRDIYINIPIEYYKYSFDDITWSDVASSIENKVTIDFSGQSEGTLTLYLKYITGSIEVEESKSIYQVDSTIDCTLEYVPEGIRLAYSDAVPFKQVSIYDDSILIESFTIPLFTGFDAVTTDELSRTLQINSGTIYYKNSLYSYSTALYSITSTPSANSIFSAMFYFDLNTLTFNWEESSSRTLVSSEPKREYIYKLFEIAYYVPAADGVKFPFRFLTTGTYTKNTVIPVDLDSIPNLSVIVEDLAGRTLSFTREKPITLYDNWKTLTVTDTSLNTILPGQIHFKEDLIYSIVPDVEQS